MEHLTYRSDLAKVRERGGGGGAWDGWKPTVICLRASDLRPILAGSDESSASKQRDRGSAGRGAMHFGTSQDSTPVSMW